VLDASGRRLAYVYGADERFGVGDDRYPSAEGRGAGGAGSSNQLLESRTIWRRHSIPNGVKAVMA
jgi:hypothetical protein